VLEFGKVASIRIKQVNSLVDREVVAWLLFLMYMGDFVIRTCTMFLTRYPHLLSWYRSTCSSSQNELLVLTLR